MRWGGNTESPVSAVFGAVGCIVAVVLVVAFIGVLCGLCMWSCDTVRELMP